MSLSVPFLTACSSFVIPQAALQQSNARKPVGTFLSQLSQLPRRQLWLWHSAQQPHQQPQEAMHVVALAHWLRQACDALQAHDDPLHDVMLREDPVAALMCWLMQALVSGQQQQGRQHGPQRCQHQRPASSNGPQQQQGSSSNSNGQRPSATTTSQQQQPGGGDSVHPAEAIRQVVDVLMSALQHRLATSMSG